MITINEADKIHINNALSFLKEIPAHKNLIVCPVKIITENKTKAGVFLLNSDEITNSNTQGDHNKKQLDRMYDSEFGVVIAVSELCDHGAKKGDLIRFRPLNAYRVDFMGNKLALINELDFQTTVEKGFAVFKDVKAPSLKPKSKPKKK